MYKYLIWEEGDGFLSNYSFYCKKDEIRKIIKDKASSIHFVGVGGVGMYSLFVLTKNMGLTTSGSDRELSRFTEGLICEGEKISIGHSEENAYGKTLVVYTSAVSSDNPEIKFAEKNGILTASRAEYLGAIMENYQMRIGVSGTHGKSTVTAMLSCIFESAGKDPTTLLGAVIPKTDSPIKLGGDSYFIYEACEYKDAFLHFSPTAALYTNLEFDHMDYFRDIDALESSFLKSMMGARICIVNTDDCRLRSLIPSVKGEVVSYGEAQDSQYRAEIIEENKGIYSFWVHYLGERIARIDLRTPGKFNVLNALGAFATAHRLGIPVDVISKSLSGFSGIERRMERIGSYGCLQLYYDYAHHPTEIECTLKALREITEGRVYVIFKPHTYSRTEGLFSEFVNALSLADGVYLCEISAIREKAIEGVSSEKLASLIGERARRADDEEIKPMIDESGIAGENGALVIMGAANMDYLKKQFLECE